MFKEPNATFRTVVAFLAFCCCSRVLAFSNFGGGGGGGSSYNGFAGGSADSGGDGNYFVHIPHEISWEEENPFINFTSTRINHFTTVGMPISGIQEEFHNEIQAILHSSKHILRKISIPNLEENDCHYLLHASDSTGGQLWGALAGNSFQGFLPHFGGKSRIKMTIMGSRSESATVINDIYHEGDLVGVPDWDGAALEFLLDNKEDMENGGGIPMHQVAMMDDKNEVRLAGYGFRDQDRRKIFVSFPIACPNFGCFYYRFQPPTRVTIQLAGFAEEAQTFDSVEDYELWREQEEGAMENPHGEDIHISSKCFGTGPYLGENKEETTHAMVVGHIIETELRVSKLTGQSFYWALVKTGGDMEIDVVIHPGLLQQSSSKPPQVGGVFSGHCYLSGLLMEEDEDVG